MDYQELKVQGIESFVQDEISTRPERIDRFVEMNELFGPQGDMLLEGGIQSQLALHELANSYVNGNYMAVVLLCQAFIEHSLSGKFIQCGEDKLAESTFKKIIDAALQKNMVDQEVYNEMEVLRKLRNPYVHAKIGLKNGSLAKRMLDEKIYSFEALAQKDAFKALSVLKCFMRKNVLMWCHGE